MRARSCTILHLSGLIGAAIILFGCAASPVLVQNSVEDYNAAKTRKVGVAIFIPDKRVLFTEQIYFVFGYSMQHSYHAYEGIWDPIPVLRDKVFDELKTKYEITPINMNEVMPSEAFSALSQACEKNYSQNIMRVRAVGHHNEFLREKLPANLLNELKALNIDYFLEIYLASISFYDFAHYDWITSGVETYSRLNRVSDGSIIWLNKSRGGFLLKNLKSLTELENNDMALLKQGYQESVSKCEVLTGLSPQQ
jgi:hypothetical protein